IFDDAAATTPLPPGDQIARSGACCQRQRVHGDLCSVDVKKSPWARYASMHTVLQGKRCARESVPEKLKRPARQVKAGPAILFSLYPQSTEIGRRVSAGGD